MRVLVLGGSGQLGSEIVRLWRDDDVLAPPSAGVNVEDAAAVERAIAAYEPDLVVNCTAFHHVERCEAQPERAFAVNALAVERLAALCARRGCVFVTYSTDYVFDGELGRAYAEHDRPNPINAYGISKLAGELLVLRLQSKAFVVRTCGVYGTRVSSSKGYTFVDRILAQARAGEPVRVVDDMVVSPTYAAHLARATRELVRTQAYGLYHAVNEGAVSWYAFACEALRQAGIAHPVQAISSAAWSSPVRRPRCSALENARLHEAGITLPPWQHGLTGYLEARSLRGDPSPSAQ